MTEAEIVLLMSLAFVVVLLSGHPLISALGGLAVIFAYFFWGSGNFVPMFMRTATRTATTVGYVCVPLFILMGCILERSGVAERLFETMYVVLGRLRGGLAQTTIVVCTLLSATTGIIGASVTIMGLLALPSMLKYGYDKRMACGTVMASGGLGSMIPPSVVLIIYGMLANVSIAKLFLGGLTVGLFLAGMYIAYVYVKTTINPSAGPPISEEEAARYSTREKLKMILVSAVPIIALVLAVLGTLIFGISTPNEAAAFGCLGAIIISMAYKKFSWAMFKDSVYRTMTTTALVMWIVLTASMFTSVFLGLHGGKVVSTLVTGFAANKWVVFSLIIVLLFVMGLLLDTYGLLLVGVPLFTPIMLGLGFDPIWFGMIFVIMIQISQISPPFAYGAVYLRAVAPKEVTFADLYWASLPFIVVLLLAVVICCIFPGIATWLPSKL